MQKKLFAVSGGFCSRASAVLETSENSRRKLCVWLCFGQCDCRDLNFRRAASGDPHNQIMLGIFVVVKEDWNIITHDLFREMRNRFLGSLREAPEPWRS